MAGNQEEQSGKKAQISFLTGVQENVERSDVFGQRPRKRKIRDDLLENASRTGAMDFEPATLSRLMVIFRRVEMTRALFPVRVVQVSSRKTVSRDPGESILDLPVAPDEVQELMRRGLGGRKAGHPPGRFLAGFSGFIEPGHPDRLGLDPAMSGEGDLMGRGKKPRRRGGARREARWTWTLPAEEGHRTEP